MPVESDYNLLVDNLNALARVLVGLRAEVEGRLLDEKRDGLDPNSTYWVNLLGQHVPYIAGLTTALRNGVERVLLSRPGEAVFRDQAAASAEQSVTTDRTGHQLTEAKKDPARVELRRAEDLPRLR